MTDNQPPGKRVSNEISVWRPADLPNVELRRGTNVLRPYPRHWHEEFQICFVQSGGGELSYRGVNHPTPPGSLFVVQPLEVHENQAHGAQGCSYRSIYVDPRLLQRVASSIKGSRQPVPYFPQPMIFDEDIVRLFLKLHLALETTGSTLERESLLWTLLLKLVTRNVVKQHASPTVAQERQAVKLVREFLTQRYAENVSLMQLAQIAGLSPFYLCRMFRQEVGMPPHAYQTQVRILVGKTLLQRGLPIARVALQTGFADQSHFSRHFKRLMAIPPGRYAQNGKIVQDGPDASV